MTCQCWHLESWKMKTLKAPFWRLYFNLDDGAWIRRAGRKFHFEADRLYLVPPGIEGDTGLESPVRHLFMHFQLDAGDPMSGIAPDSPHALEAAPCMTGLARRLAQELLADPLRDSESCPAAHALLAWALAESTLVTREALPVHDGVARVISILQARNYPAMNNTDLAEVAHMSVNGFVRAFASVQGEAPQLWLRRRRIGLACQRLAHTSDTIEEIAESLQFANRFHFSSVFRAVCGTGPATWRRKIGSGMIKVEAAEPGVPSNS